MSKQSKKAVEASRQAAEEIKATQLQQHMRSILIEAALVQVGVDEVKEEKASVSGHLLGLAKRYGGNSTLFLADCLATEKWAKSDAGKAEANAYLSKHGGGSFSADKMPAAWTQAKSNIKRAVALGIDIAKYDTESALRKELGERRSKGTTGAKISVKGIPEPLFRALTRYIEVAKGLKDNQKALDAMAKTMQDAGEVYAGYIVQGVAIQAQAPVTQAVASVRAAENAKAVKAVKAKSKPTPAKQGSTSTPVAA